ncbi:hypothetical protein BJ085DRAFT_33702 [Dimargaris cristalligena]|uniref:Uncharacterized protein n=1 Tax=Dimargaris cristalligena TaxID=215637 RepID=A0A4Q0A3Z5_9FUNG|nr:hypothetical protein BJ085DRAFT_33702 [Dimargaris cristalligena]|eukprot:RKP39980.1 hypothetical protein BJ085DRAFT_33702 [Dimargaris cristalligena]
MLGKLSTLVTRLSLVGTALILVTYQISPSAASSIADGPGSAYHLRSQLLPFIPKNELPPSMARLATNPEMKFIRLAYVPLSKKTQLPVVPAEPAGRVLSEGLGPSDLTTSTSRNGKLYRDMAVQTEAQSDFPVVDLRTRLRQEAEEYESINHLFGDVLEVLKEANVDPEALLQCFKTNSSAMDPSDPPTTSWSDDEEWKGEEEEGSVGNQTPSPLFKLNDHPNVVCSAETLATLERILRDPKEIENITTLPTQPYNRDTVLETEALHLFRQPETQAMRLANQMREETLAMNGGKLQQQKSLPKPQQQLEPLQTKKLSWWGH